MKILSKIKSLFRKGTNTGITFGGALPSSGLDDTFLFDFKNYQSQYTGVTMNSFVTTGSGFTIGDGGNSEGSESPNKKIAVKPKDVLNELETVPTPWTLSNLDDKIEVLKYKADLFICGVLELLKEVSVFAPLLSVLKSFDQTLNFSLAVVLGDKICLIL